MNYSVPVRGRPPVQGRQFRTLNGVCPRVIRKMFSDVPVRSETLALPATRLDCEAARKLLWDHHVARTRIR